MMSSKSQSINDHDQSQPVPQQRAALKKRRRSGTFILASVLLLIFFAATAWFIWLFVGIRYYATHDQARPLTPSPSLAQPSTTDARPRPSASGWTTR